MTERKWAHVLRRRWAEEVRATYWTSTIEMLPTSCFWVSTTAREEMPWETIVSRAVRTRASALIEMTYVEPIPNSPI